MPKRPTRECPVEYPNGSWMGIHHFEFRRGTQVELGTDAGYFCVYCGVSLDDVNLADARQQRRSVTQ